MNQNDFTADECPSINTNTSSERETNEPVATEKKDATKRSITKHDKLNPMPNLKSRHVSFVSRRNLKNIGTSVRNIFHRKNSETIAKRPPIARGKSIRHFQENSNPEIVSSDVDAAYRLLSKDHRFSIAINNVPQNYRENVSDIFKMEHTRIQKLVIDMRTCLEDLGYSAPLEDLEKWSILIYESMMSPSRTFHSVQHVFDVAIGADSIQKLAAFFHDIIYYSIDGGLNPRCQTPILEDVIDEVDGKVYLTAEPLDSNTQMVLDIFGFQSGQLLDPYHGLNEILSSICAVRCYQSAVEPMHLAQIVACIEATIPFRKPDAQGRDPPAALFDRLNGVNDSYNLDMVPDEIVKAVQRSCDLGNRDLKNFATPERAVFLSNTWNLLPESNIPLRNVIAYRISDFAMALKKMSDFFSHLDPEVIYTHFRSTESELKVHRKRTDLAAENIRVALMYMNCKRLAIAALEAISILTGDDAPIALFLGDLPERHYISPNAENYISYVEPKENLKLDKTVFQLLRYGRESESSFDIKNSPFGAYLYALLGDDGVEQNLKIVAHPMDHEQAMLLLKSLPFQACNAIISACAKIAITRQEKLTSLLKELEK
jgi:hypothetical protein